MLLSGGNRGIVGQSRQFVAEDNLATSGPKCTVCSHPEKWRIELLRAGGASGAALAKKFRVSKDAIFRHWHGHVSAEAKAKFLAGPAQMAELHAKAAAESDSVLDHFRILRTMLMAQLACTTEAGDARGAAAVAGALISVLDKIGRVTGELAALASHGAVNVNIALVNSPAFAQVQAEILRALAPYADARMAVVSALRRLDAEPASRAAAPRVIEATALPPPPPSPFTVPPPPPCQC